MAVSAVEEGDGFTAIDRSDVVVGAGGPFEQGSGREGCKGGCTCICEAGFGKGAQIRGWSRFHNGSGVARSYVLRSSESGGVDSRCCDGRGEGHRCRGNNRGEADVADGCRCVDGLIVCGSSCLVGLCRFAAVVALSVLLDAELWQFVGVMSLRRAPDSLVLVCTVDLSRWLRCEAEVRRRPFVDTCVG